MRSACGSSPKRRGEVAIFPREETTTDTFGIYVHWPFCAQKCPYCDFNSHVRHEGWDEARFRAAFLRELEWMAARIDTRSLRDPASQRREVTSIFFGGGTPSLMQPETVAAILERIGALWPIAPDAEITIEANPGSVEAARFAGYRAAGVNRVSLGVQSLDDEQLRRLGRIHTVAEARAALDIARRTFDRVSFDLIYARPGQTLGAWRSELAEALSIGTRHLSLYQLTIEPGTTYERLHAAGKLLVPGDEAARALYDLTQEMTEARGLAAYEVSNHAAPGEESRHNLLYWRYGEYAGVGPGAHGRLRVAAGRHATQTERNPEDWAAQVEAEGHGVVADEVLSPEQQADEALLMGLRLTEGLDLARLAALGGGRPSDTTVDGLADLGLVERIDEARIRATRSGRLVLNAVVAELSKAAVTPSP